MPNRERTDGCLPGIFVPKLNGKVRLVVDYRGINCFVKVYFFPSPRYVVQGYYLVPLDKEASKLTTFLMLTGSYQFLNAPMGLNRISDAFCACTDSIMSGVPDVMNIVDHALLQAPTKEALQSHLRIALTACRAGNLTLNREKLLMGTSIPFAGYTISNGGVLPDPKRLLAVAEFPVTKDITAQRRFLRLVNQLGFFVPNLAHLTELLQALLKKKELSVSGRAGTRSRLSRRGRC
jgi:hypothetical protein